MNLLKIARRPPVVVAPGASVMQAVEKMVEAGVGAVAVVHENKLVGIFTERDLQNRVVAARRSALDTPVREVMTPNPHVAPIEMEASEAFAFMTDKHFRHLPIVDGDGKLLGMLSVRHLMRRIVETLARDLEGMNAYLGADGIGG